MNSDRDVSQAAYRFAHEGMADVVLRATSYINNERLSMEKANAPELMVVRTRQGFLMDARRGLLREAVILRQRTEQRIRTGSGAWSLVVAVILMAAAFGLAAKTLEVFRLGWVTWVFCTALALAVPYALDRFLQDFRHRAIIRIVIAVSLTASLATVLLFGLLRGGVLARLLEGEAVVLIDSPAGPSAPAQGDNTDELDAALRRAWALAAVAFELAAALALFDFREGRRAVDFGALRRIQKELLKVEEDLLAVTRRLHELLSGPGRVEAAFWGDFERGLHDGRNRSPALKRLASLVLGGCLAAGISSAADLLHAVSVIDLSKTQEVVNYSGRAEFRENVEAVSSVVASMPAGSRLTVIAITDLSYVNPLVLLDARTSPDPGAFSSRLTAARRTLLAEWKKRSGGLAPSFNRSDVLGALRYAGEVLARSDAQRKLIVLFSDGRNYSDELDLETPTRIEVERSLRRVEAQGLLPSLRGVEVFLFGGGDHSGKRGVAYTVGLKAFWTQFVERSGGTLRVFSTSREAEAIRSITSLPVAKAGVP